MRNKETDLEKYATYISLHKVKCKHCGYPAFMTNSYKFDKMLCRVCKHYIYKNDLLEFKDRLKAQIRKEEQNVTYKN